MEFKQWLYSETVWRLSDVLKPNNSSQGSSPDRQNLAWRAANGWLGGVNDVQKELLYGKEGGPREPSLTFPSISSMQKAYKQTQNAYHGKSDEEAEKEEAAAAQAKAFPVTWDQAKYAGEAIGWPQTINGASVVSSTWVPEMTKAFEALLQKLPAQGYSAEKVDLIKRNTYIKFLNPPRPTPDATGNLNFEFVIPKPEYIE